jgi:hypothetical protein
MQHEITEAGPLLDEQGGLAQRGFSRRPLLTYNPERLAVMPLRWLNRLRLKEWDYYAVTSRDWFFSVTVANVGYLGMAFAYFIDFVARTMQDATTVTPFGLGAQLPPSSRHGDIAFHQNGVRIAFVRKPTERRLFVNWPKFGRGGLQAELVAQQPASHESIVMATPMGPAHFYYNEKINCLPTTGYVQLPDRRVEATPASALTSLDWGRGAWPYQTFWNWASASGFLPDGRTLGLNLGKGFGDLSAATENCFFVNGMMDKLEQVDFVYDPRDFHQPWRFASSDGRLALTFTPFFERSATLNLVVLATAAHQMFGRYTGTLRTAAGETIAVRDLLGWTEEHRARW